MKKMGTSRRDFLRTTAAVGRALGLGLVPGASEPRSKSSEVQAGPEEKLKILVLGGTGFIGPHMVQFAVDRGHQITLFTGLSNTELFPELEKLVGDRNGDWIRLRGCASGCLFRQHRVPTSLGGVLMPRLSRILSASSIGVSPIRLFGQFRPNGVPAPTFT